MLGITRNTVATCQERTDRTEEVIPRVELKANVQLDTIKALHDISCYWGPERVTSSQWKKKKVSWELEQRCWKMDGNCVFCHTHEHFPAMGNKNYHVGTISQLIWKTIKNGQGYGGRGDCVREINTENGQQQNQRGKAHPNGRFVIVTKTIEKCNRNHDSRFTVSPKLKKKKK